MGNPRFPWSYWMVLREIKNSRLLQSSVALLLCCMLTMSFLEIKQNFTDTYTISLDWEGPNEADDSEKKEEEKKEEEITNQLMNSANARVASVQERPRLEAYLVLQTLHGSIEIHTPPPQKNAFPQI